MPRRPVVSVIVPTYQRRDMVARAVASVLAQSWREFELIVVDDGSTDGTAEALAPLGDRLRYHRQPNRGASAARNAGIRLARGSLLAFLDSDDRWLPDHLAVVTEMLARNPGAVLATTTPMKRIRGRAAPSDAYLYDPLPVYFFAISFGYTSAVAVRHDAVLQACGFDERMLVHEGVDLFMRMAQQGPFCMLERRTIVKSYTSGLKDWGRRNGHYLDAFEYRARRVLDELEAAPAGAGGELAAQARAALALVAAMRALERRDEHGVQRGLADACRLAPQLSTQPEAVRERLEFMPLAHDPAESVRHYAWWARLWPDPRADTALYLRLWGAWIALRNGHHREAAALLGGWPLACTPGFARRHLPAFAKRIGRSIDAARHAADDGVDLDAAPASSAHAA